MYKKHHTFIRILVIFNELKNLNSMTQANKKKWSELYMWLGYSYGFWAAESESGLRISPRLYNFPPA